MGQRASRIVVVSGGPSSASDVRASRRPVAAASDRPATNSRRLCTIGMEVSSLGSSVHEFAVSVLGQIIPQI